MDVSLGTIAASFALPIFLGGIIFTLLRASIKTGDDALLAAIKEVKSDLTKDIEDAFLDTSKCEKALHKRIDKFDHGLNLKMSKGGCQRVQDRIGGEFRHMKSLIEVQSSQNNRDHEALIKTLDLMGKKQDAITEGQAEMITCLALLSENIPCTPVKDRKNGT